MRSYDDHIFCLFEVKVLFLCKRYKYKSSVL